MKSYKRIGERIGTRPTEHQRPLGQCLAGRISELSMRKVSKRFALLSCAVLFCGACAVYPKKAGSLRLLQYNVGSFGKYMDNSTLMIADMVRELDADIVSLNEVDSCNRRHHTFQSLDLADALGGWNQVYGRAMSYKGGSYGNAVICPEEIIRHIVIPLDKGNGAEARCAVLAETRRYVFVSAHLDYKMEAGPSQARQLSESVKSLCAGCGKPVFLAGDMNNYPDSETIAVLQKDWELLSVTNASTFPCPDPNVCIDYIMVLRGGPSIELTGSSVADKFKKGNVETASDHYPLFVDIRLK